MVTQDDLPDYRSLILPTVRAVDALGGSAQAREIRAHLIDTEGYDDEVLDRTYEGRAKSILVDRMDWARSYAKLGGALESPRRGLFVLTPLGKEILDLPQSEAHERVYELDRAVRDERRRRRKAAEPDADEEAPSDDGEISSDWKPALLARLHDLSPEGFEEFVMYLLRTFGLEIKRVGGTGDEGIDGIGLAPLNEVLSARVAVQVKRHAPDSRTTSRAEVALFQRDADSAGAEKAIFVTLAGFSESARRAATMSTPTVDLIDGDKLCDLCLQQQVGIRVAPEVDENWFARFET